MIDRVPKEECCLCKACSNICPAGAIRFNRESHGFLYPRIDESKCLHCQQCEQVCPSLNAGFERDTGRIKAYTAYSLDLRNRRSSTSGGVFFECAKKIIAQNGYVCGVLFDDQFRAYHEITNDLRQVERMRGSKYVQSDVKNIYRRIKNLLTDQIPVLFCGCPCQVAGLRYYLGRIYDSLYLIELICHGAPGQRLFDTYRDYLEEWFGSKITHIEFRSKRNGWHNSSVLVAFENGRLFSEPRIFNAYMKSSNATLKDACYTCKYNDFRGGADLTLGDAWGAEALFPEFDDNQGLSTVLVQTEKGKRLFDSLDVQAVEYPLEDAIRYNRNIIEPTAVSPMRSTFFAMAEKEGYSKAWKRLYQESFLQKCRRVGRFRLRCLVRKIQGREKPLY
ncbi:MAG: Coenzyme F420 hydrogenase/dehydrogenase, beta subunit C-terminal domain [Clostridia bacterium]|nr:Coenzyme F420 hydrogenase/dehydrogenase, beta subunit C-terminal domain [Clostridia bacterium]